MMTVLHQYFFDIAGIILFGKCNNNICQFYPLCIQALYFIKVIVNFPACHLRTIICPLCHLCLAVFLADVFAKHFPKVQRLMPICRSYAYIRPVTTATIYSSLPGTIGHTPTPHLSKPLPSALRQVSSMDAT